MSKDYYQILDIEKGASKEDVKKAFRKLAHKYHPDKTNGNESRFKEVSEAYSVLSDDKKRAEYDSYGRVFSGAGGNPWEGFSAQGFQNVDLGDIFGDIFGNRRERVKRGRDISIDLEINFYDSVFGTERKVLINKIAVCEKCEGSGAKDGTETETCKHCNGKGRVHETARSFLGTFTTERTCKDCHGAGKIAKEKCKHCGGLGTDKRQEEITIKIPAGIDNGEVIRLSGEGEAVKNGVAGDLYARVHIINQSKFRKQGRNLTTNLSIKMTDAVLGGEYEMETLDGKIKVKIPKGINHGEILRVKGKGVPFSGGRGDLMIDIKIELPKKLSRKAKKSLEDLREEGI
jgi:molecular chaperone DnaJ